MKRQEDYWFDVVATAVAILVVGGFIVWLLAFAPCGVFRWASVGQIPARCLSEYLPR